MYKYLTFNRYTERIFTHGEVYVRSPLEFNDPFDCTIPVFPIGTVDNFRALLHEYLREENPTASDEQLQQWTEAKLSEGEHSDPMKMKQAMDEAIENRLRRIGVYCLSAKNDDILMWSHYANSHRGFCLEFEDDSPTPFLNRANKVTYQKELPIFNFFDENWHHKFLTTKSERWSYEEEWRIIEVSGPGICQLPEGVLSGVIFGCKMPDEHINKAISWVSRRPKSFRLYGAHVKSDLFGLDIVRL